MKTTITIFAFTVLTATFTFAQTVHSFYVMDFNTPGYIAYESVTVEAGDQIRFLNGTGGTYNFEIEDPNDQPNFVESGVPNGQIIYEIIIGTSYPSFNEITVSEYGINPSFIKTLAINKITNTPPVLSQNGIYDRILQTGATLSFVATASDADNDPLSFDLDANSLSKGMVIDAVTGIFGWLTDVNGSHDGYHTVTITVSDGMATDSKSFEVAVGVLDVNELDKRSINIYPNPAQDVLSISSDVNLQKVTIISAVGELVYTGTKTNNIDISSLRNGVYFVTCAFENNEVLTKRIVKN